MSVVSVREMKKRDKEQRIRGAALELIRARGYAATTTAAVAERAGIAAGTLFLYVKTKEELLDFLFAGEIAAVVDDAFRTLPRRGDIVKRLGHLFGRLLNYYYCDLALARALVGEALLPRAEARSLSLTVELLQRLAALIHDEQTAGRLTSDAYPVELATHAFTLYLGGVLAVVNQMDTSAGARQTLERALEIHFRGLRPRPARRARATKTTAKRTR
ncbi:MAG: Transcriptional regulator, TetR family [bacterium]|nr:Transcriptional regulator, TetR family [bacterium]